MGTLGSGLTGLGNVQTAGEPPGGAGTPGTGTLNDVTSADGSVIVTSPSADVRDLKENGVYQLIDSYAVVNDSPAINAALTSLAARPHNNGVLEVDSGGHRLGSVVNVPSGCSIKGAGKNATNFIVAGNGFDAFSLVNPFGSRLSHFRMTALAPRTSGRAIYIKGGNVALQPFLAAGGYTLSANETEVDQVDLDGQFDGVVVENNGAISTWLVYIRNGRYGSMNGGDGIRINCPGTILGTDYGASFFVQRVFVTGLPGALTGNALAVHGAGDFTIEKFQSAITFRGLFINPQINQRLSTGRFSLCQFDTATGPCCEILPAAGATFMDIGFDTCWFAGGGTHNFLLSGTVANSVRVQNSFFFFAAQYGMVITGLAAGCSKVIVLGNQFSGAGTGGFRAVAAHDFDVSHNQFYPGVVPPGGGMPQAVTVDLGCADFRVDANNWVNAAAGLLDNSGAVNKVVQAGNI